MKEPNSQRGTSAVVTMSQHMQRRQPRRRGAVSVASGERCSRGRAPGRRVRQKPPAVKSGQQISSREEIPSREVGRVRSCAEQKAIGGLGQDLLSFAAVPDLGQEEHFLARTIRGIAYVEDVEPVAAKVTLELVAFAKA